MSTAGILLPIVAPAAYPRVSVIMPVYNEDAFIGSALAALLQQDYPQNKMEILVADGMSSDRTRAVIHSFQAQHPQIRLIDNPERIVSTGLNRAIRAAAGEVIVRVDGHCEYPNDYVRRVVELRERLGADNVGGVLVPVGKSYVQRAVAKAYCSPVGFGGAALKAFAQANTIREVDAVHGGCWNRERLLQVGGFDERMVRNQDDELSFRLRKNYGKIYQCLSLRVNYHVRDRFGKLFRQFFQYGYWKVQVVHKHPRQASVRHVVPGLLVLALGSALALGFLNPAALAAFALLASSYVATLTLTSLVQTWDEKRLWPGVVAALVAMHIGYGTGFVLGCVRNLKLVGDCKMFIEPTR